MPNKNTHRKLFKRLNKSGRSREQLRERREPTLMMLEEIKRK